MDVFVGDEFVIDLEAQGGAGYCWAISEGGNPVLRFIESNWIARPDLVGAPGTQSFRFCAERVGLVSLQFKYGRQWESTARAQRAIAVRVLDRAATTNNDPSLRPTP